MLTKIKGNYLLAGLVLIIAWNIFSDISILGILGTLISVLSPLAIGLCLAFIVNMPLRYFETKLLVKIIPNPTSKAKRHIIRTTGLVLAILSILLVLSLVVVFAAPQIASSITELADAWPAWYEQIQETLTELSKTVPGLDDFMATNNANLGTVVSDLLTEFATMDLFNSALSKVSNIILGIFLAVYILFNKERMGIQAKRAMFAVLPEAKAEYLCRMSRLANLRFSSFIKGQLFDSTAKGIMFLIVLLILGFPLPVLVSVIIMFSSLVPIFGTIIGFIITLLLTLMARPGLAIWFIIVYIILEEIEENIIYPHIVGKAIGLNGFWVLLAVSVGAGLAGIAGIIFAIPITSVLYTIAVDYVDYYIKEKDIPPERFL
jgi:predicted PurR-regulated permease PerM